MIPYYSIKDTKQGNYATMFPMVNDDLAKRNFLLSIAGAGDTPLSMFPADFELYKIGEFDEQIGHFYPLVNPEFICNAASFGSEAAKLKEMRKKDDIGKIVRAALQDPSVINLIKEAVNNEK